MSEQFSPDDLRELADALERLTDTTQSTGVALGGYNHAEITLRDHVIRLHWRAAEDVPASWKDATEKASRARGQYVIEFPDPS